MSDSVTLTINGKEITVPAGTLIVDAAKGADIDIPVFCYHPKMEPVGMCRMCLVEVGRPTRDRDTGEIVTNEDGTPKIVFGLNLETACTLQVSEGMVVRGESEKAKKGRQDIIEFILTSHPLDCPICDKGGECPLQNLTMDHGSSQSRFILDEKIKLAKHLPLGELIYLDRERCIQCARCTRFQDVVVDDPVIGFYNRGRRLEIVTFSDPGFDSYWSGNTTDICPVGALTTTDFRFGARPWELIYAASLSPHSPVGANLTINVRREAKSGGRSVIKRIMPRQNEWVNEIWISDKDRFAYHFAESDDRLKNPLLMQNGEHKQTDWSSAIQKAADAIQGKKTLVIASGRLSNEDLYNISRLAQSVDGQSVLYSQMAGGDLTAQFGVGVGTNLKDMGKGDAILVVASDLEEEAPLWWLRVKQASERGTRLIVANPRPTKLDRYADFTIRYEYGQEADTIRNLFSGESQAAREFVNAENAIIIFGNEGLDLDGSALLAHACADLLVRTKHTGKANNGLIGVWERANNQGAWDMGFRPVNDLHAAIDLAEVVYIAGADPVGDDPSYAGTLQGKTVIVHELFMTETAQLADIVLPAKTLFEREGTYTSGERRVQRFFPAVTKVGDARSDFDITRLIAEKLGLSLPGQFPSLVFLQIAENIDDYAGLNYQRLAETHQQYPIIGREDMYYGGTGYKNEQGLGVQLMPGGGALPDPPTVQSSLPKVEVGSLLAVPVNTLYNRSTQLMKSEILHQRISVPFGRFNPADSKGIGVLGGETVQFELDDRPYTIQVRVDESVPQGVVLVPRKMGIPLHRPTPVSIHIVEMVAGS